MRHPSVALCASAAAIAYIAAAASPAWAQQLSDDELRTMLLELKQEQSALNAKIDKVESLLADRLEENISPLSSSVVSTEAVPPPADQPRLTSMAATAETARLQFSGDLQLRYEGNFSDVDAPDRNRGVMRGRIRADYQVNSVVTIGAEMSTGDADDPNSVHVTLSDFVDDFEVNLSRMYARLDFDNGVSLVGGKFANPFMRTDLVWDGDVNPQGAAAMYSFQPASGITIRAAGVYSIIEEASLGPDSDMLGGQVQLTFEPHPDWRFTAAVGYYDYSLDTVTSANAGDFRDNLQNGLGGYLSDFDLFNVLASASYLGLGEHWPVTITEDYVKNLGAAVNDDEGFGTEISLGQTASQGDWRFAYGYSQAEIDAVLGAFSHDNLGIATNYQSHLIGIDYALFEHVILNATLYHYKPLNSAYAGVNAPHDWLDRLRLNLTVSF